MRNKKKTQIIKKNTKSGTKPKQITKKSPLIKEDFYFLYHTCPQMLDNLTNWKITINQDT